MQLLALENNLSETAFVKPRTDGDYDLRWFTPAAEIEFCGHATIASAHVLFAELDQKKTIIFHTQIGELVVENCVSGYKLRAPNYTMKPLEICTPIKAAFGETVVGAYIVANNLYVEFLHSEDVKRFTPLSDSISDICAQFDVLGVSIMAVGDGVFSKYDFISRHFAPVFGVDEDPVTGSAHSAMAPFWADRLNKTELIAYQASKRGGILHLSVKPEHVYITGEAVTFLRGEIYIPE